MPHHLIVDRCYVHGDRAYRHAAAASRSTRATPPSSTPTSPTSRRSAPTRRRSPAGTARARSRSRTTISKRPARTSCSAAPIRRFRISCPSDIEIVRNHLAKPLRWRKGDPSFEGVEWTVKNLFELKNARRVLVDGNLLEYNWPQAQNGFAILFTVRNQDGGGAVVDHRGRDVHQQPRSPRRRRHQHARTRRQPPEPAGAAHRDPQQPVPRRRRQRGATAGCSSCSTASSDVTIDHNTAFQTGGILFGGDHAPHTGFVFQNNIVHAQRERHHRIEHGRTAPTRSNRYFPGAVVPPQRHRRRQRRPLSGRQLLSRPRSHDAGLTVPRRPTTSGWRSVGRTRGAATDGRDPGADVDAIAKALDGLDAAGLRPRARAHAGVWRPGAARVAAGHRRALLAVARCCSSTSTSAIPLIAWLRARAVAAGRDGGQPIEPTVSIVVVAHNEAERIGARIENLLALDYPRAEARDRHRIRRLDRRDRRARARATNGRGVDRARLPAAPRQAGGRQRARARRRAARSWCSPTRASASTPQTVRALVANFADPHVGAVSGELVHHRRRRHRRGRARRRLLLALREIHPLARRAASDSTIGATGAIYAIRRALFEPIPEDTLLDDVLIPLRIVRRGYRVRVRAGGARVRRRVVDGARRSSSARRGRSPACSSCSRGRGGCSIRCSNRLWFETISHKVLRAGAADVPRVAARVERRACRSGILRD